MRVAIDYDGTIANTNREKASWIKANLGKDIELWDCNRTSCVPLIGEEAYRQMSDVVYERARTLAAEPVPGALDALVQLACAHDVYVVSARPERRLAFAGEWLHSQGGGRHIKRLLSSYGSSKSRICGDIGAHVLIDDDIRHLARPEMAQFYRLLLYYGRSDTLECPPGIHFCRNWHEILAEVRAEADRAQGSTSH